MDKLVKALGFNEEAKIYIVRTTQITNDAINKHDLWPSAASVLGKTMTIGLLMGGTLKQDQALTVKIDGNGPIGHVIVDANGHGEVRGYVGQPHVTFSKQGKIDEVTTLGYNGYIDVIKDLHMNDLFTSSTELITGDLAKDFTYYLMKSEQVPSALLLGSKFDVDNTCKVCGGLMIQLLPNASEETISYFEKVLENLPDFSELLEKYDNLEDILTFIFKDTYRTLEDIECKFVCPCSHDRFKQSIARLGAKEVKDMIDEGKDIEVVCHYCNSKYNYSIEELQKLYDIIKNFIKF